MYLAILSERLSAPVLICPEFVATAMSAIVESSVSPERCEVTEVYLFLCASSIALRVWLVSYLFTLFGLVATTLIFTFAKVFNICYKMIVSYKLDF